MGLCCVFYFPVGFLKLHDQPAVLIRLMSCCVRPTLWGHRNHQKSMLPKELWSANLKRVSACFSLLATIWWSVDFKCSGARTVWINFKRYDYVCMQRYTKTYIIIYHHISNVSIYNWIGYMTLQDNDMLKTFFHMFFVWRFSLDLSIPLPDLP